MKERLSKTGVFFRADTPCALRNFSDGSLPIFVEIINGVEQEAHTTGSSVSSYVKRAPLQLQGVNVFVKPTGARHQFTVEPLLLGTSKDLSFDARAAANPWRFQTDSRRPSRFPATRFSLFLPATSWEDLLPQPISGFPFAPRIGRTKTSIFA